MCSVGRSLEGEWMGLEQSDAVELGRSGSLATIPPALPMEEHEDAT